MEGKIIHRYSDNFKRQVIEELESGKFSSIEQARLHYEIGGGNTIKAWLKKYGKNHLRSKVVRVEKPNEADRIGALKNQINDLERSLGRTQAKNLLNESYLELACEQLGQDVEEFKKKRTGQRFTKQPRKGAQA